MIPQVTTIGISDIPLAPPLQLNVEVIDSRAVIPAYAHYGDACFDISVIVASDMAPMSMAEGDYYSGGTLPVYTDEIGEHIILQPHQSCVFHTGWKCGTDMGKVLMLFPRSSTGIKKTLRLSNSTGIIDTATYRGEVLLSFTNFSEQIRKVYHHDRLGQGMLIPVNPVQINVVDSLDTTERGEGGLGSSGN